MEGRDIQGLPQGSVVDERVPLTAWPGTQRNWNPLLRDSSGLDLLPPIPDQVCFR